MELLKKKIHTQRIKTKSVLQIPLESDINVSDTKSDVSKIIYSTGKIRVDEIKTGMNKLWVKGRLCYQLMYQALGGEENISGMEGEIPFMEEIYLEKSEEITGQDRVVCNARLDDMRTQLINSRKLSIQSVVTLEPQVSEVSEQELCVGMELPKSGETSDRLEYRNKNMEYLENVVMKKDLIRIHEETNLPIGMSPIGTLLWKNADIKNISFRPVKEKLAVSGEISIFTVYREDGSDKINWYEATMSFDTSIECQGSADPMIADVTYNVGHEEISVREDADGEARLIGIDLAVELEIKLYERQDTQVVSDVYGVNCDVNTMIETRQFKDLHTELNIEEKLTRTLKIEESEPKILQVCHSDARVRLDNAEFGDNMLKLKGDIELWVLYSSQTDQNKGLYSIKDVVGFEVVREMPVEEGTEIDEYHIEAVIPQQTASIKDSQQLEWRGSLAVKMYIYGTRQEEILTELNVAPINPDVFEKLPGFVIYYVKPGDSLWQIGKKYYVSVQQIKSLNNLTGDDIKPGDKLLIVK